jgi:hypothetical protein
MARYEIQQCSFAGVDVSALYIIHANVCVEKFLDREACDRLNGVTDGCNSVKFENDTLYLYSNPTGQEEELQDEQVAKVIAEKEYWFFEWFFDEDL